MSDELDARAKRIIDEAIELRGAERESMVAGLCAGDTELRLRVDALLSAAEREDLFLRDPTLGAGRRLGTSVPNPAEETPGARIGPYRILELIGEGGFGSVYMAEQTEPVRRRVALKIIKLGMDTRAVVARFEQERQALALMDHANIAKVLDAGATQSGRPYFVMELVKGEPITEFCDGRGLTIPERLELFRQVCLAVQHAHTKGIIHRDIKPGNVLVSEQDGRPMCRVIDFGIAKATQRGITEKTVFTEFRQLVGTPEYMSPEQAAGSLDIDTRSDVYSLGVLLYEMLAGVTPLDAKRLRSAAYGEMQRMIREEDPPAPSTRLSEATETLASVAAQRRVEPRRLGSMIRGELDWIVMRALEKDRARRYDSPGNLAADVGRYLAGEPVEAAPAGAGYRVQKFVRRNRGVVVAGSVVAGVLVIGLATTMWQARVASRERDAARASAKEAELRRKETEQVARFQAAQLGSIDPPGMGERVRADIVENARLLMVRDGVPAAEIEARRARLVGLLGEVNFTDVALRTLDASYFQNAIAAARREFGDQPLVRAELLLSIGGTMRDLALMDGAGSPLAEAVEIRRRELGDDDRATIMAISTLGILRMMQGRNGEGELLIREARDRASATLGPDDDAALNAQNNLGLLMHMEGREEEAERVFRQTRDARLRAFGPDHIGTLKATGNLALVLSSRGKLAEAEPLWREALAGYQRAGNGGLGSRDALATASNLALDLVRTNRVEEADSLTLANLETLRRRYGEDHPNTIRMRRRIGIDLGIRGELDRAERIDREVLGALGRALGDDHRETLDAMEALASVLLQQGRAAEALPLLETALAGQERKFGKDALTTTLTRTTLGSALTKLGRFAEAEAKLLATERTMAASNHVANIAIHRLLAELYEQWDRAEPGKGYDEKARRRRENEERDKGAREGP